MDTRLYMWGAFFLLVSLLLALDMGVLHRRERDIGIRESLWLSAGYILVSLLFGLAVYRYMSPADGRNFIAGYFIEKSLSLDNILIISAVFSHFHIPHKYQHRVLFWGILGVVVLRGAMVGLGSVLIQKFHFILFFFAAFLILTGLRMVFFAPKEARTIEENTLLTWLRRWIPVTQDLHGNRFFAYEADNRTGLLIRKATPLFLVLLFIESADIVFAVDSVPAVFAITTNTFVVYTSNIFAILGLRALYFSLAAMLHRFTYLKYALALVLMFIGGQIFCAAYLPVSSSLSLAVTLGLLGGGVVLSLYKTKI